MKQNLRILMIAAVAALPAAVNAGDAGIAKMSYKGYTPGCTTDDGCNSGGCNPGACYVYCDPCGNGAYCSSCNGHCCSRQDKWNAWGMNWCDPCGPVGKAARKGVPGAACLCYCCNTKAFPDAGWAPPAHNPMGYSTRGFSSYHGNSGPFAGPAPMVYQPTDTTQLGYSYANVPTWQPDQSRIPPVPQPSMFHNRVCQPCGGCRHGCNLHQPYYSSYVGGAACPTCDPGMVMMVPADMPVAVAGPASFAPIEAAPAPAKSSVRTVSSKNQTKKRGWFGLPSLKELKF